MKTKKNNKKLFLGKKTISNLRNVELDYVKGGLPYTQIVGCETYTAETCETEVICDTQDCTARDTNCGCW